MTKRNSLLFDSIKNLKYGVILVDEMGKILYTNRYFDKLLAYKDNELLNKKIWQINYILNSEDEYKNIIKKLDKNRVTKIITKYIKKDRKIIDCNCSICIINQDNKEYYFSIVKIDEFLNKKLDLSEYNYFKEELQNFIKDIKQPLITIETAINAFELKIHFGLEITSKDIEVNLDGVKKCVKDLNILLKQHE